MFQVARPTVNRWVRLAEAGSVRALRAKRRGRPTGTQVAAVAAARVVRLIVGRCPDQLRLPFTLWTREAVRLLLRRDFGVELSVWTVGRYLQQWGLTPQKADDPGLRTESGCGAPLAGARLSHAPR